MSCKVCGMEVISITVDNKYTAIVDPQPYFYTSIEEKIGIKIMIGKNGLVLKNLDSNSFGYIQHKYYCKGVKQ
jgi:hypothetical protein